MYAFSQNRNRATTIFFKILIRLLGLVVTTGYAVAGEDYMDTYKQWGDGFIGKSYEAVTCIPDTINCKIFKKPKEPKGFRKLRYHSVSGLVEKGPHKGDQIAISFELNGNKVVSTSYGVYHYPKTLLSRNLKLHWATVSPDGFFEVLEKILVHKKSTEQEVSELMQKAGLLFHRKVEKDSKFHLQYARPLYPKGSFAEQVGWNNTPDAVWLADFIFENGLITDFARKPTGFADFELMKTQILEVFNNNSSALVKR